MKIEVKENKDKSKTIITLEDYWFNFKDKTIRIPAGYRSDGASVPRIFWGLLSPPIDPITLEPSVAHDFLYDIKIAPRREIDYWYIMELSNNGYPDWKCILTLIGIRAGGRMHY